jgi:hypothetical protein
MLLSRPRPAFFWQITLRIESRAGPRLLRLAPYTRSAFYLPMHGFAMDSPRQRSTVQRELNMFVLQVLEVFRKYRDPSDKNHMIVNELACWCLNMLSLSKENAVVIAHAGGVKLVSFP